MSESRVSTYADITAAYLETDRGRANFRESRERFGYGYQRALCVAVMVACKLRIYERITAVVEELMRLDVAA